MCFSSGGGDHAILYTGCFNVTARGNLVSSIMVGVPVARGLLLDVSFGRLLLGGLLLGVAVVLVLGLAVLLALDVHEALLLRIILQALLMLHHQRRRLISGPLFGCALSEDNEHITTARRACSPSAAHP